MRKLMIGLVVALATPAAGKEKFVIPAPALPPAYQEMASSYILSTLREPETAKIEFRSEPYQMVCDKGVFRNKERMTIWMVDLWVNGRNGFGGFTGFEGMSVAFYEQDGNLMQQAYTKLGGGAITRFGLCKRDRNG